MWTDRRRRRSANRMHRDDFQSVHGIQFSPFNWETQREWVYAGREKGGEVVGEENKICKMKINRNGKNAYGDETDSHERRL